MLQVLDNIALAVVGSDEPGTSSYLSGEYTLRLVDLICCGAILFPIVWQVRALEEAVAADEKAERTIRKLTLFRQFYILVVCYIYFTRIIVFLIATMLTYKESWIEGFFNELATLMFYITVGYKFRPQDRNPYISLRGHEDSDDDVEDEVNIDERCARCFHRYYPVRSCQCPYPLIHDTADPQSRPMAPQLRRGGPILAVPCAPPAARVRVHSVVCDVRGASGGASDGDAKLR